ncbi:uncharacterized protein E0L32_011319 [Thyridium curvatum]|uniref:S-adenosyl-L-methionine-dependent methyltransferase n=1 Tax=Thyridium curvatum TaxID=1093900 RepID=A0A507B9J9_9PEZI|nr:uncharacterized protein E0L32_011319 [Thyridium curvatum]TPX19002.1 hypothetical protein E0L32_011319 [Thyridium curvatum]
MTGDDSTTGKAAPAAAGGDDQVPQGGPAQQEMFPLTDVSREGGIEALLDSQMLEVDDRLWDGDSAVGGLTNVLYEHIQENGRTYHRYKEGKYPLPNDELEQDRLDFQHKLYRLSLDNRLYAAPIGDNPRNVLDVATGTGIWAIEFAQEHPGSHVVGTDLSPIQPTCSAPSNVTFEICDAEDEWSFPQKFDFVHMRAVVTCFRDPKAVFAQARDALQPGGYLQLRDPIMPFKFHTPPPEDCALVRWNGLLREATARIGRRWDNAQHYARWLRELGFVDVREHEEAIPLSPWAKSRRLKYLSLWLQHDMVSGLEGMSMALFTRVLGWEGAKVKEFVEEVKKDICNPSIHAYGAGVLVWGRKPLEGEVMTEPKHSAESSG